MKESLHNVELHKLYCTIPFTKYHWSDKREWQPVWTL